VPELDAGRLIRTQVRDYRSGRSTIAIFLTALIAFAGITISGIGTSAAADPSADDWYRLRVCESGNNYAINTGNGYFGAYQFDLGTWRSVGGSGYPNDASPATQDALALRLWQQRGWGPWACARILGLTGSPSATPPPPPPPAPPVGSLDAVTVSGGSAVVAGWAFDPGSPGTSIQTHVYVNSAGYPFVANSARADVNAAFGVTGGHGFGVTVPLQPGSNNVCAYAIGVASGNNVLLGCRTVVDGLPLGSFDSAAASGGVANIAGWAFDRAAPARSIPVDVYVNGVGVRMVANQPRADVNAAFRVTGRHGFTASVALRPGANTICVFAIGVTGNNPSLGCRAVQRKVPLGSFDSATVNAGVANISGWAFDQAAPASSIPVAVHVNGVSVRVTANAARADVNAAFGVSGRHGFVASMALRPGANSICVWAIGTASRVNPSLGCRSVQVSPPAGSFDTATVTGGVANVTGWAVDRTAPARSIPVDVYVNGVGVRVTANKPRADVNSVLGVTGQHGFSSSVPLRAGANSICVYAIGLTPGNNPSLGCRQVQSAQVAAAPQAAAQAAQPAANSAPSAQDATTTAVQQPSAGTAAGPATPAPPAAPADTPSADAVTSAAPTGAPSGLTSPASSTAPPAATAPAATTPAAAALTSTTSAAPAG